MYISHLRDSALNEPLVENETSSGEEVEKKREKEKGPIFDSLNPGWVEEDGIKKRVIDGWFNGGLIQKIDDLAGNTLQFFHANRNKNEAYKYLDLIFSFLSHLMTRKYTPGLSNFLRNCEC